MDIVKFENFLVKSITKSFNQKLEERGGEFELELQFEEIKFTASITMDLTKQKAVFWLSAYKRNEALSLVNLIAIRHYDFKKIRYCYFKRAVKDFIKAVKSK